MRENDELLLCQKEVQALKQIARADVALSGARPTSASSVQKHQHSPSRENQAWNVFAVSKHAKQTVNPIRRICDTMAVSANANKTMIKLHLGDPTLTGSLPPCPVAVEAIEAALRSRKYNGYGPAVGIFEAREAVARHFTRPQAPITSDDVVLASGCSHALQMAIEALADPADNILVPCPGFPLYSTLMRCHGIEDRRYQLDMREGAQINLEHLESLIDQRTRAIIINNPSNPTGIVFSKSHLEEVLRIAYKHRVPIIADEIYGELTYGNVQFVSLATLEPKVPIITCDGIGKRYVVPGWRLGWLIVHDRYGAFSEVRKGLVDLSQKIVGPCALIQGALPMILSETPSSFFNEITGIISENAATAYSRLSRVPGLHPVKPNGAMYMMIGIDEHLYGEETSFVQGLIAEESVFCLPGSAFNAPSWFRIVLTYPLEVTVEACDRITEYCRRRLSTLRRQPQMQRRARRTQRKERRNRAKRRGEGSEKK
ncbi:Tyrosine aminotransferase [Toxocara canis]|uniref:Tyrosine aminotransferase n=1 Tax=Toxocara canis TaxID=6265 RepID=A0A0B2VXQ4_TOXCA|nr:Tyrosine aminotransferase [Toxocara canis]